MAFVRSFNDFTPPARFDDVPFTSVRIEEGASSSGPWVEIATIPLDPVDTDPSQPASREFTTSNAVLDPAWYRLVWLDALGGTFVTDSIHFGTFEGFITPDDIAHTLGQAQLRPEELTRAQEAIAAAVAWARWWLRDPYLGETGTRVYDFYDVHSSVAIPAGAAVQSVRTYSTFGSVGQPLDATRWYFDGSRVHVATREGDLGLPPEETFHNRRWHRVQVTVSAPTVGPIEKRGVALAATALFTRSPSAGRGLRSENLGDYSYTLSQAGGPDADPFFAEAKQVLRPLRRSGVQVVP